MAINKLLNQMLEDYIRDKTDIRLEIFSTNINPNFKLTKSNKAKLVMLISDFERDKTNQRFEIILSFLGNVIKKSEPKIKTNPTVSKVNSKIDAVESKLANVLKQIKDNPNPTLFEEKKRYENELLQLAREDDKEQIVDSENEEKKLIKRMLGDYENDNKSIGYRILNNLCTSFHISGSYDPKIIVEKMFELSGKRKVEWNSGVINATANGNDTWMCFLGGQSQMNQGVERYGGGMIAEPKVQAFSHE